MNILSPLMRRARKRVQAHRFVIVTAVCGIMGILLGTAIDDGTGSHQTYGLICTGLMLAGMAVVIIWNTTVGVSVALIAYLCSQFINTGMEFCKMVVLVCSMLIVSYSAKRAFVPAVLSLVMFIVLVWRLSGDGGTIDGFDAAIAFCFCFIPYFASRLALTQARENSLTVERLQLRQAEQELAIQRRDNQLSRQIHDAVSNDLSRIIMLADSHRDDPNYGEITERAREALRQVHCVIDLLDSHPATSSSTDNPTEVNTSETSLHEAIKKECQHWDEELHQADFLGTSTVLGEGSLDKRREQCIRTTVQEAYTNILRHCSAHDDEYSMTIRISEAGVRIMQTNSCRHGVQSVRGVPSGKGLKLHRDEVYALGGQFITSYEDGTWLLNVYVPAAPAIREE